MIDTLILSAAAVLLIGLLLAEKKESWLGILLTKPFLSTLFIIVALSGPHRDPAYYGLVLAGLVSFLIGHILYAIAFSVRLL